MYLAAIQFVQEVKQGAPFAEHSPILNDISALPSWRKVNDGLQKMYEGEVLGKLPVMQHMLFGSLFPADWTPSRPACPPDRGMEGIAGAAGGAASGLTITGVHPRALMAGGAAGGAAGAVRAGGGAAGSGSSSSSIAIDLPEMTVAPWLTQPAGAAGAGTAGAAGADMTIHAAAGPVGSRSRSPQALSPTTGVHNARTGNIAEFAAARRKSAGGASAAGSESAAAAIAAAAPAPSSPSPAAGAEAASSLPAACVGLDATVLAAQGAPTVANFMQAFGPLPSSAREGEKEEKEAGEGK